MIKLARLFSFLVEKTFQILPWWVNRALGHALAFIWVDLFRIRKKIVFDNIEIAFPGTSEKTKLSWMQHSLYILCRGFFDLAKIPTLTDQWIDDNVVFHGQKTLAPFENQGLLVMSLHIGSGDLAAAIISRRLKPLSLISKRFKNKFLDEFWFSLRQKSKSEFIDAHGKNNSFEILRALKRKRGVVFVIDQYMGKPYGIKTDFFGRTTGSAYGLALFAQKTKTPALPIYSYWDQSEKLHICVGPVIDLSDLISEDTDRNNLQITNRFNNVLEDIIKQNPSQWMWVHRRWKAFSSD